MPQNKYEVTLSDGRKFVVEANAPPSEQDVMAALGPQGTPAAAPEKPATTNGWDIGPGLMFRGLKSGAEWIKNHPVETAAGAGAMAAAPFTGGGSILGGMAAAGLGAAGGAGTAIAGRQLVTGKPESGGGTLRTMATQGAANAAGEGIGRGVVAGANLIIPKILKGILRPYKGVQQEFGDVVDVMRKEQIPVGKSDVADARMMDSASEAKRMIAEAEAAGAAPIQPREVTPKLREATKVTRERAKLGKPDESGDVAERARQFTQQNKAGIPLSQAQTLKTRAQKEASNVFRAIDRGNPVNDTGALMDKAMATGLREAVESRVPAVAGVNSRTKDLMGLTQALEDAEARSGGVVGLNPANWLSGLAPGLGSKGAFAADSTAQGTQGTMARAVRQALLSLLAGDSPEGPD